MKKLPILIILVYCSVCLFAQHEVLTPLTVNPKLYNTQKDQASQHKYLVDKGVTIVKTDTLSLPFIDDFSRNTLPDHNWLLNNRTDTAYNVFGTCLGPEGVATVRDTFMLDTSWVYTYDVTTHTVDSTAKPVIQFSLYAPSTSNCFTQAPSIQYRWPKYYTYSFDSSGFVLDSTLVTTGTDVIDYAPVVYFATAQPGKLWFDNSAYLNNTYPIEPPTIGVVTLDGLNENGFPYNNTNQLTYGDADSLTSLPINLQGLSEDDSVYLSFFFEGKGLGESPDEIDSLILEFKDNGGIWRQEWFTKGYSSSNPATQKFQQVLVKVPTLLAPSNYFHPTFQFRFRNKASLYGNLDHWHIDYVKLDQLRSAVDTAIQDVAFVYPFPTLLKNYTYLPADQMTGASDLRDSIALEVHNLDPNADNNPPATNFTVDADELYPTQTVVRTQVLQTFNAGSSNYVKLFPTTEYAIPNTPNWPVDSLVLESHVSLTTNDSRRANDTLIQRQTLSNLMAYDDGSAESAYGITGTQPKRFAYEFELNQPDTLVAVQFMYTQVDRNVSDLVFNIALWDSLQLNTFTFDDATTRIKQIDSRKPYYLDTINGFTTYVLDTPIIISDKVYLGWLQSDEETRSLQVGFDLNSPLGRPHMYIYTGGQWKPSSLSTLGSPMMRLIFDTDYYGFTTGIVNYAKPTEALAIYPNPTTGYLHIGNGDNATYDIAIYNTIGQNAMQLNNVAGTIDVNSLPSGIYMLVSRNVKTGVTYHNKIIKTTR